MGGQMLGGGVVLLVAVLLWLLYLLPSIMQRSRYDAAERNALRLNRALRVLAETSEAPDEVRVELSARQARQQQKAAAKAQAEVDRLRRERDEIEAEQARLEREREAAELEERRHRIESEQAALERREAERELEARLREDEREAGARMRAEARRAAVSREAGGRGAAASGSARRGAPAGAAGARPGRTTIDEDEWEAMLSRDEAAADAAGVDLTRARVRRRVRLAATLVAVAGIVLTGWGAVLLAQGVALAEWAGFAAGGIAMVVVAVLTLRRMAQVARRAAARAARRRSGTAGANDAAADSASGVGERRAASGSQPLLNAADRGWTPRRVPAPLSTSAGSITASAADARAAREQLLAAAREEGLRERAEQLNPSPVPLERARRAAAASPSSGDEERAEKRRADAAPAESGETAHARAGSADAAPAPEPTAEARRSAPSPYAAMGYVDDAEIEEHLRTMLGRRRAS